MSAATSVAPSTTVFRHEALFYAGADEFLAGASGFVKRAVAEGAAILVVVSGARAAALRAVLGDVAEHVEFGDMEEVGRNPARIIPVWRRFVEQHAAGGRPLRGIGEPVWAGRSAAELAECHRHEALLNLAFEHVPDWWLLCAYDTSALAPDVLESARSTHPFVLQDGLCGRSSAYEASLAAAALGGSLPAPAGDAAELAFTRGSLPAVRRFVERHLLAAGLDDSRASDLVFAVNELVTNSVRHGGGGGTVSMWSENGSVVCEVRDAGEVRDPLVGRRTPDVDSESGRGLWLVNQLCDLVQVRSSSASTVVRVHMEGVR